jgi:hypothetical protein
VDWHYAHRAESPWKRAAGTYVRALSMPQLFIEGNHRTGALIVSYLLVRSGYPPFVLTRENAKAFFDPSTVMTKTRKTGYAFLMEIPKIKRNFAKFLQDQGRAMGRYCLIGDLRVPIARH